MKKRFLIIGMLILVTFISACTTSLGPKIELNSSSFDMGDINPDEGIRTETFFIKNTGDSLLTISDVSTSCGCTEAEVDSKEIRSGEETILTVKYDPSVHPGLVGEIKRIIYIKSNDPLNEEIELELIGNSLPSSKSELKKATPHKDNLKDFEISPSELSIKITNNESFKLLDVREKSEYEENHIKDTFLLSVNKINQAELDKLGFKKDDEIILYCRSGKRSAKAYEILKSLGYTNVKSMAGGIVHWMGENLDVEKGMVSNEKEQIVKTDELFPSVKFDHVEHDFGKVFKNNGIINTTFLITNEGNSNLELSSMSTSCGCTTAKLDKSVIFPGESTNLTVFFDPNFHEEPSERFSRTIFLETNDPENPETELIIWIDLWKDDNE